MGQSCRALPWDGTHGTRPVSPGCRPAGQEAPGSWRSHVPRLSPSKDPLVSSGVTAVSYSQAVPGPHQLPSTPCPRPQEASVSLGCADGDATQEAQRQPRCGAWRKGLRGSASACCASSSREGPQPGAGCRAGRWGGDPACPPLSRLAEWHSDATTGLRRSHKAGVCGAQLGHFTPHMTSGS